MDSTPGSITLTWFFRKVPPQQKLWLKITGEWDGKAGTEFSVLDPVQDTQYTKRWPWKTHDDQMAKAPDGKLAGYGACDGKYTFDLSKLQPQITSGKVTFHIYLAVGDKQPSDADWKKGSTKEQDVADNIKQYILAAQTADKKPLPTVGGKPDGAPQVFYGIPFNLNWKADPGSALTSLTLKGHPDGDQKLSDAIDAKADKSGDFAVTLKGTDEKDITFTLAATKSDGSDDPTNCTLTVHAMAPTWRAVFPMRAGTKASGSPLPPSISYTGPAPAQIADAATLKSLCDGIAAARAKIPKRTFYPDTGKGNVYMREGWASRKIPKDTSPEADASRAFSGNPPTGVDPSDNNWTLFKGIQQVEGLTTTVTCLAIDPTLTIGAGFSTAGSAPQRILDALFKQADGQDNLKFIRPSAMAAGFAIEPGTAAPSFIVADISDPANPCILSDANKMDASNFLCVNTDLLSFITNLLLGAQTDLVGSATLDGNAQRQASLDQQYKEVAAHALNNLPNVPSDAQVLIAHARHAGHIPGNWDGGGANTQADVASNIWSVIKGQQGDTSSGSKGDATHGPTSCCNICKAICAGFPAAATVIKSKIAAEVNNYSWDKGGANDSSGCTWK